VAAIDERGAAAAAGLREGDVVIRFDGQLITGIDDLHRLLTEERIDRAVPVAVLRSGQLVELTVTPRELEQRTP